MKYAYPAEISLEHDGSLVTLPDLPGISGRGQSRCEAIDAARTALVAELRRCARERRDMPRPSAVRGREMVDLPLLIAAKAALYQTMREQNVTNVALAKRMHAVEGTVRRLVDLGHRSHIDQVESALALLGKRLVADMSPR